MFPKNLPREGYDHFLFDGRAVFQLLTPESHPGSFEDPAIRDARKRILMEAAPSREAPIGGHQASEQNKESLVPDTDDRKAKKSKKRVSGAEASRKIVNQRQRRHGRPLLRPASKPYTKENNEFLKDCHRVWARTHGGAIIPLAQLTEQYNARFPAKPRSSASIRSHMSRELKGTRGGS